MPVNSSPSKLVSIKVDSFIVAGFIGSLNVAVIIILSSTSSALAEGSVESTIGGVMSDKIPVVKFQETSSINAFPEVSSIPLVIVAVKGDEARSKFVGVKVAVRALTVTVPSTALPL